MKHPFIIALLLANSAFANYRTDRIGKTITCFGPDELSVNLNITRTQMKVVIEGEGGSAPIKSTETDGRTTVSYISTQGSVTFSDQLGDFFVWSSDDPRNSDNKLPLKCK